MKKEEIIEYTKKLNGSYDKPDLRDLKIHNSNLKFLGKKISKSTKSAYDESQIIHTKKME